MRVLGLAAMIVVLGVFLPEVLQGLENFLLKFIEIATHLLEQFPAK